jgi:hypothetical protein
MGESARDDVLRLALPQAVPAFATAKPFAFSNQREAVAAGAQPSELTDAVPAEMRGVIRWPRWVGFWCA